MVSSPTSDSRQRTILTALVDMYLQDKGFNERSQAISQTRNRNITTLKGAVERFIVGTYTLTNLREQIDTVASASTTGDINGWGAMVKNFVEVLAKLANEHDAEASRAADTLRRLLSGLNTVNLGQRIGEFYTFLVTEEKRFQDAGRPVGENVSPGYSAFIISMFAFWLNAPAQPIIYYQHLCHGMKILLNLGLLPRIEGLHVVHDRIEVQSQADHQAFLATLDALISNVPQLRTGIPGIEAFWAERFTLWVTHHPYELEQLTKEDVRQYEGRILDNENLPRIEETQFQKAINELRRRVLVDEKLVRRIYHALLAGHVILTGPPGTGKTELAKLIPELLWQQESTTDSDSIPSTYTTHVVTATDEWSVHTLLGGIVPRSIKGQISYTIHYGYLTDVIRKNWLPDPDNDRLWRKQRITSYAPSKANNDTIQEFRGRWLVIDEFNRAPIDLALGEVLTTLGSSGGILHVPTDEGDKALPLPRDFRIIGTLNSFDRNYLNQISEALKRRFSFIEVLPPTREQRNAEQAIVLYTALSRILWLSEGDNNGVGAILSKNNSIDWRSVVTVTPSLDERLTDPRLIWYPRGPFRQIFENAWHILEVIRIYRQLGTAQAITLFQQMFIAVLMQSYKTIEQWNNALDDALCDTIADQLQVLMPDELNILYWYIKRTNKAEFVKAFNEQLPKLHDTSERRLRAQLESLSMVVSADGNALLSETEAEKLAGDANARMPNDTLTQLFYLDEPFEPLPQFASRLRTLRAERGL